MVAELLSMIYGSWQKILNGFNVAQAVTLETHFGTQLFPLSILLVVKGLVGEWLAASVHW